MCVWSVTVMTPGGLVCCWCGVSPLGCGLAVLWPILSSGLLAVSAAVLSYQLPNAKRQDSVDERHLQKCKFLKHTFETENPHREQKHPYNADNWLERKWQLIKSFVSFIIDNYLDYHPIRQLFCRFFVWFIILWGKTSSHLVIIK